MQSTIISLICLVVGVLSLYSSVFRQVLAGFPAPRAFHRSPNRPSDPKGTFRAIGNLPRRRRRSR